jgi:hypothetical protein
LRQALRWFWKKHFEGARSRVFLSFWRGYNNPAQQKFWRRKTALLTHTKATVYTAGSGLKIRLICGKIQIAQVAAN